MSRILSLLCLNLSLVGFVNRAEADEEPPKTLSALEFRVLDVGPNTNPVGSFRYGFQLFSSGKKEPLWKSDVAYRSEDGILRIPKPFPPFGRICVWIEADDLKRGFRYGYASFSYRIDPKKPTEPTVIRLELGEVLTGKVLDAETKKPIVGSEVASLQWGHHGSCVDWDESTKTDDEGKYRVVCTSAAGIAARHPNYRDAKLEYDVSAKKQKEIGPGGVVLRLEPLVGLRGRVVDPNDKPIADVSVILRGRVKSDGEGRFLLKVTRKEWEQRKEGEHNDVMVSGLGYHASWIPLADFSFDRETVVRLEPGQRIQGQVLDENGKPLENCVIELKKESGPTDGPRFVDSFRPIPGPHRQGKWAESINKYDGLFTLRISVAGSVRSLKEYTLEEVTRGPIVTRLNAGRECSGRLVAKIPLDEKNTPAVVLSTSEGDKLRQRARVQPDGRFAFFGLADGKYTLRLHPTISDPPYGDSEDKPAFTRFAFRSTNRPWEKSIAIQGSDLSLEEINLHETGVLPGRVKGVAYQPDASGRLHANAFGYICGHENDYNSVGGTYHLIKFMTDADGRFEVDSCPPGKYLVRLSNYGSGYRIGAPGFWIRVTPEETLDLRPFAPGADHRLAVHLVVGDGSSRDIHAGAALDPKAIAKHTDPKTGKMPYIRYENERFPTQPSDIFCKLEPLDETITHWPTDPDEFEFSPRNLVGENRRDIVIPNVSPGRWRLTLSTSYHSIYPPHSETLLTRDVDFAKGMAPLTIKMPAASLTGSSENPVNDGRNMTTIEVVPADAKLPTRTHICMTNFRFIGLSPGKYTVRYLAVGCRTEQIDNIMIRKGEVTRLKKVVLVRTAPASEVIPVDDPLAP